MEEGHSVIFSLATQYGNTAPSSVSNSFPTGKAFEDTLQHDQAKISSTLRKFLCILNFIEQIAENCLEFPHF